MSQPTPLPTPLPESDDALRVEDYFRDGAAPADALLWWQLERQEPLQAALRALFQGDARVTRLRLWVFLELMALRDARLTREALNHAFHLLRDEVLDSVLKRLRDADLLAWDATGQTYAVTPLAQQLVGLLQPLTADTADQDADLASLLAGVAGAHQLGHAAASAAAASCWRSSRGCTTSSPTPSPAAASSQLRRARHPLREGADAGGQAPARRSSAIIAQAESGTATRGWSAWPVSWACAQARLLAMASQFNRALQQADRQRVTLGSTGITTTDVRRWLQSQGDSWPR